MLDNFVSLFYKIAVYSHKKSILILLFKGVWLKITMAMKEMWGTQMCLFNLSHISLGSCTFSILVTTVWAISASRHPCTTQWDEFWNHKGVNAYKTEKPWCCASVIFSGCGVPIEHCMRGGLLSATCSPAVETCGGALAVWLWCGLANTCTMGPLLPRLCRAQYLGEERNLIKRLRSADMQSERHDLGVQYGINWALPLFRIQMFLFSPWWWKHRRGKVQLRRTALKEDFL